MSSNSSSSDQDTILEQYFGYLPSVPLAVIAVVLYFVISLPLFWQSYRSSNRLTYVLPITALVECAGYITRLYTRQNPSQTIYIVMVLFIILAPNALAFANYKLLGNIIHSKAVHLRLPSVTVASSSSGPSVSKRGFYLPYLMTSTGEVHGNRLAGFFFVSDVAAIMLQGMGGGIQSSDATLGTDILLFGLASQLLFFAVFTILAIYVYVSKMYQEPPMPIASVAAALQDDSILMAADYDHAFRGLFATIGVLYARNIYRVTEGALGYGGYLSTTEIYMYLFDALFIFIAFVLYIKYNFAAFLSKADAQLEREMAAIPKGTGSDNVRAHAMHNVAQPEYSDQAKISPNFIKVTVTRAGYAAHATDLEKEMV